MKISIIICTHDHLASLRETLRSLEKVRVPFETELLLVENACTDGTADFVETVRLKNMSCRALHEPQKGQVRARNLGLSVAKGEWIVFTDDDVRFSEDWLEKLGAHFGSANCDALIGCIRLAPHLERPWMTRRLRSFLSVSEGLEDGWLTEMIGANMAFRRAVLQRVPRFDEELGPGALGFGDDSLFSWQLEKAGFHLCRAPDAVVEHHCDESRLLRKHYLDAAKKHGKSQAYLLHHWKHEKIRMLRLRYCCAFAKLLRRRLIARADTRRVEGCAEWEISLTAELEKHRAFLQERQRPRHYEKNGLIKLSANSAKPGFRQKFFGFFMRKERWALSWRGWLALVLIFLLTGYLFLIGVHPFLAVTNRADKANVLVVEGWVHEFAARTAAAEFKAGNYQRVFVTGVPVEGSGEYVSDGATESYVGAGLLRRAGIPGEFLQTVPRRAVDRDRTYGSAIALKDWFREHDLSVQRINVLTEGTHARRTRLLFQEALGNGVQVGVIAAKNPDYDARHWWRYSEGVREVIGEGIAYIYAKLFFYPEQTDFPR